ncbi:MAG: histone deacetylase family protein [Anaerolineae bacterium]
MKTVYTSRHRLHGTDQIWVEGERFECKEVPQRAEVILTAVEAAHLGEVVPPIDHGLRPILAVHDADYVDYLRTAFRSYSAYVGRPTPVLAERTSVDPSRAPTRPAAFPELRDYYTYDYEDPIVAETWEAAYWSAQTALTAAKIVAGGERTAYALCRPPGHHAMPGQYGGFCYLNNAAVAARALSKDGRVAILDLDYHHGNGTQAIFYEDPSVLYVSLHADPQLDYPYYWGYADEVGSGPGAGTNVNLPLPIGASDDEYLGALEVALEHIMAFGPKALVLSLGADAVSGDPIGKFRLTVRAWAAVARRVAGLGYPTIVVQEGGYDLSSLGSRVVTFLLAFAEHG